MKILVVDDEELIREFILEVLSSYNFECLEAKGAYEAMELLKTNDDINLCLLDIIMPKMNGLDLSKKIKDEINPKVKIILMTGDKSNNIPLEAIRLKVDDFIYKPFELEELIHCINKNLKLVELELKNQNLEEEKLKNEKLVAIGKMTNTVVHDVKNALTTIMGVSKLIQKNEMSREKLNKFTSISLEQTKQILEKLEDILEFSKGNVQLTKEKTNILELFNEINCENRNVLEMSEINFNFNIEKILENRYIYINIKRIKQVFYNLLINSKDAVLNKEIKEINLQVFLENKTLKIILKDTGKGIKQEYIEEIFKPFETFEKEKGTGLGLAIVKQSIEANNGKVKVESKYGEWTKFIINFPIES